MGSCISRPGELRLTKHLKISRPIGFVLTSANLDEKVK